MLKMRRIILIAVIALTALSMSAEKITVTINKQYRQDSAFVLPSKTISVKAPCMGLVNAKYIFTKKLMEILSEISVEDYDNKVFTVKLLYAGRGISINISSDDPLDDLSVDYCGDIIVGGKHFLLVQNDDNKDLIKTFFRKVRGYNVVFERTFEKVFEVVDPLYTSVVATYDERQRTIINKEKIINAVDKLHAPKAQPQTLTKENGEEDDDAFKIDVELFQE